MDKAGRERPLLWLLKLFMFNFYSNLLSFILNEMMSAQPHPNVHAVQSGVHTEI